jgi:hypothetical protein
MYFKISDQNYLLLNEECENKKRLIIALVFCLEAHLKGIKQKKFILKPNFLEAHEI